MNINEYTSYRSNYLQQYSQDVLDIWHSLETIETWTLDSELHGIADIFNSLPSICRYPLSDKTESALAELIGLIAYLPFIESVTALAWCGFNNDEWGVAIYDHAYTIYNESIENDISQQNQIVIAAKTIVQRVEEVAKITTLQAITGRSI
ncbi:hypothetical protein ACTFQF_00095 [Aliivibrio fischeri]|uniref:Uncharacterized protein n=1 Tax=Aliivibrio fischeri (strain MJ11) TaxID=388396 RepID=B5EW44_ALIFM|nr:hypothetical protein [Aliivibrio fischeri]ACH64624.1 hypothetical protein VFMJ11_B0101 [Aliivibrio fischeri MJ11]MUK37630.1 hypothetical protein [Aliivibrio fischeri]